MTDPFEDLPEAADLNGQVTILSYRPVFIGPYSCIYRGTLGNDGQMVAIKVLNPMEGAPLHTMKRKLKRERSTWAAMNHPNILPLFGFADDHETFQPFGALVSPWLRHGDASNFLAEHGTSMTTEQRIELWKDVIEGVEYLHSHTPLLVHGDLKPRNILIDDYGRAQICDFGLVRIFLDEGSSGMTTTTNHTGTERYLAYELVATGEFASPTTASDIYAVGCIGLEFIFSQLPHPNRANNLAGGIFIDLRAGVSPGCRPPFLSDDSLFTWGCLEHCWDVDPTQRPPAGLLLAWLKEERFSFPSSTVSNGVGKLPALGWNSWCPHGAGVDQAKIITAANQFVSLGLKAVGYQYINVDVRSDQVLGTKYHLLTPTIVWLGSQQQGFFWRACPGRYKVSGRYIGDRVKDLTWLDYRMNLGYRATSRHASNTGSLGFEEDDAATFSSWGVDYLKYNDDYMAGWRGWDLIGYWSPSESAKRFRPMGDAIRAQPRPMQINLCIWGRGDVFKWGPGVGQSWRIGTNSTPDWQFITSAIANNVKYLDHVTFYAHNDMDAIQVGSHELTIPEQRTQFAMWVALKSPIFLGVEMSKLSPTQLAIIKNTELLAFHQDNTVGVPAKPYGVANTNPPEHYAGESSRGTHVFIMNTASRTSTKTIAFPYVPGLGSGRYKVHDMWTGSDIGTFSGSWSTSLAAHDTGAWLVTPAEEDWGNAALVNE